MRVQEHGWRRPDWLRGSELAVRIIGNHFQETKVKKTTDSSQKSPPLKNKFWRLIKRKKLKIQYGNTVEMCGD